MATQRAPYGRVFSFGKGLDIDSRAIPRGSIGWIDPDFDGLDDALVDHCKSLYAFGNEQKTSAK